MINLFVSCGDKQYSSLGSG